MSNLPAITEAEFIEQVAAFASLHGWHAAHFRPARTAKGWRTPCQFQAKGWPDLFMVRNGRIVVAELKRSRKEKPTQEQYFWLSWLSEALPDVFIWTPDDWTEIEEVLS